AVERQRRRHVGKQPLRLCPSHLKKLLLFLDCQGTTNRRLTVSERLVLVVFEFLPESGAFPYLAQHRQLAIDRLRGLAFGGSRVLIVGELRGRDLAELRVLEELLQGPSVLEPVVGHALGYPSPSFFRVRLDRSLKIHRRVRQA